MLNCNSANSPGDTHSGRRRTARTDQNKQAVKAVMDRDAPKPIGDPNFSPVSTCRINALNIDKSTWWRLKGDLKYHPYKAIRRHQLQPQDLPLLVNQNRPGVAGVSGLRRGLFSALWSCEQPECAQVLVVKTDCFIANSLQNTFQVCSSEKQRSSRWQAGSFQCRDSHI